MATTLSSIQLAATLRAHLSDTIETVPREADAGQGANLSITAGTGASQADRIFQDLSRSLTSGNSENLDLYDLAVFDLTTDVIGNTVTFAEIVGLHVINSSSSAGNLELGGVGDGTAWTSFLKANSDIVILPPDSFLCIGCTNDPAWAVTDTTNHILKANAPSGNVTYSIVLLGRSA